MIIAVQGGGASGPAEQPMRPTNPHTSGCGSPFRDQAVHAASSSLKQLAGALGWSTASSPPDSRRRVPVSMGG